MAYFDDTETKIANKSYIQTAMNEPLLEKDYEQELAKRWKYQNDEAALQEMVRSYTRLVIAMASKFRHYGLPLGDLIQEGNIGLMQAANKFEPEKDVRFSTYATWWIRAQIQDYILRNWSIVRTGTTASQKSLFFNFKRLKAQLNRFDDTQQLSDNERASIAEELNVPMKDVVQMERRLTLGDQSLNMVVGHDDTGIEAQDLFASNDPTPEDIVVDSRDSETRSLWLNRSLGALDKREQQIIKERHLCEEPVTLESLGKSLGISKERVRQLEKRAMDKMRTDLSDHEDDLRDYGV